MLILGLLAGIVCYLIQSELSFGNTPIVTLFWVMMGLCISVIKINKTEGSLSTEESGPKIKEYLRGWEVEWLGRQEGGICPTSQFSTFPNSRLL